MEINPFELRNALVDQLVNAGSIKTQPVESAFRKVPRHVFLPKTTLEEAYSNGSIITKSVGAVPVTSSTQPSLMASMLEILEPLEGSQVLEIGTGTGYNAAIIAEIVKSQKGVYSVDIDPDNISQALANLKEAGYPEVTAECYNGWEGFPPGAPYDRILATCSLKDIPSAWLGQLNEGGIIVAPLWVNGVQVTPALVKKNDHLESQAMTMGGFMNLRNQTYQRIKEDVAMQKSHILICSEHPANFNEQDVNALLKGNAREVSPLSGNLTPERWHDFFVLVSFHERKSVELFLEENAQGFGFSDSAAGIVDCTSGSACLISRDGRMFSFGNNEAKEKITALFEKWNRLGKPTVEQWQMSIYPRSALLDLVEEEILLTKDSSQWLIKPNVL